MLYIVLSFIVMSMQWSDRDLLLDIKQKITCLWFEGNHTEDWLTDFLHQRHLLRYIEQCLQYGTFQTVTEQKQVLGRNQCNKLLDNVTLFNALLYQQSTTRDWFCYYIGGDSTRQNWR